MGEGASLPSERCVLEYSYTSRQLNTHNTESREVCYPRHPWYGRSVTVYETLVKNGRAMCRCGVDENQDVRYLVPQWMFDPAACCRMHKTAVPVVGCEALRDLRALLRDAALSHRDIVLQAQHRPCYLEEVLMPTSRSRSRVAQFQLFHPPHRSPSWQGLPQETQQKSVGLLARLLREHWRRVLASGKGRAE